MLSLTDDSADRRPRLCMYDVLARFCGVHNFSFSVDKTKWVVIDFSKHCMNHSPVTIEGTTAEPPSNFQQRQISNSFTCFGRQVRYFIQAKISCFTYDFDLNDNLSNVLNLIPKINVEQ